MEVTIPVPEERLAEFYEWFGKWLKGVDEPGGPPPELKPWRPEDADLAELLWERLSEPAQKVIGILVREDEAKVSGEEIAKELGFKNKYGVAGTLAWPGRRAAELGRPLPVFFEEGPVGEGAQYWMPRSVADLFRNLTTKKGNDK